MQAPRFSRRRVVRHGSQRPLDGHRELAVAPREVFRRLRAPRTERGQRCLLPACFVGRREGVRPRRVGRLPGVQGRGSRALESVLQRIVEALP